MTTNVELPNCCCFTTTPYNDTMNSIVVGKFYAISYPENFPKSVRDEFSETIYGENGEKLLYLGKCIHKTETDNTIAEFLNIGESSSLRSTLVNSSFDGLYIDFKHEFSGSNHKEIEESKYSFQYGKTAIFGLVEFICLDIDIHKTRNKKYIYSKIDRELILNTIRKCLDECTFVKWKEHRNNGDYLVEYYDNRIRMQSMFGIDVFTNSETGVSLIEFCAHNSIPDKSYYSDFIQEIIVMLP